jgi:hypothetical protein
MLAIRFPASKASEATDPRDRIGADRVNHRTLDAYAALGNWSFKQLPPVKA